jgi:nucleoside-diphosphate-sugar epimerase
MDAAEIQTHLHIVDIEGVIHVASPVDMNPDPNVTIPIAIKATLNVLKSAAKSPSIKRFVLTSSSVAAYTPENNKRSEITGESWNEDSVKAATAPPPYDGRGYTVYSASKTQAEQQMWKWCHENKPSLVVNTVLPNANTGTVLDVRHQGFPSTVGFFKMIWDDDFEKLTDMFPPQYFVDVQDCARLHVAALLLPEAKGERIFAFASAFTYNEILSAFRKAAPGHNFPKDLQRVDKHLTTVPNGRAEELLRKVGRKGWTSLDESLENMVPAYEQAA